MSDMNETFDIAETSDWTPVSSMIKVIGVGGGGCNAVNYMYREKVEGCSFIVCNTDEQALRGSPVPVKIHIGKNSLGAGTDPAKGRTAALEALEKIDKVVLGPETQMLFITAGMGGGTGTGAAPIIAKRSKDKGILTVAVVTIPFENEGSAPLSRAIDGIHELVKNVDSLLIINNEKLHDFFGDHLVHKALPKADEVLATAVRGITEIISKPGYINVDFEDVKTMVRNSGMALMGCGIGTGPTRLDDAVTGALQSPLLNDFDLKTAKNILVNIRINLLKKVKSVRHDEPLVTRVIILDEIVIGHCSKHALVSSFANSSDFLKLSRFKITAVIIKSLKNLDIDTVCRRFREVIAILAFDNIAIFLKKIQCVFNFCRFCSNWTICTTSNAENIFDSFDCIVIIA
jgi:cell division protein FtsZ